MKGWTIAGIIVVLIVIGSIMKCAGCYQEPAHNEDYINDTSTTTQTKTPELPKVDNTKFATWTKGNYQGISYRIPPGFKEVMKKIDEYGQPFIQIANENGRLYQFEISRNSIKDFGSYSFAAATWLTLIKSMYFKDTDVNFISDAIFTKELGNKTYLVCPSDKSYMNAYFCSINDDLYCIIAVSDNMVEAESFVESIEIQ